MYRLIVEKSFYAKHFLRNYRNGKKEPLHKNKWKVQIFVKTRAINKKGIAVDLCKLRDILNKETAIFENSVINNIEYFKKVNPTLENIARYIFNRIKKKANIYKVMVWETEAFAVSYEE